MRQKTLISAILILFFFTSFVFAETQKTSLTTDNQSNNFFSILIDCFCDKENALAFFTTPAGLRWDANLLLTGYVSSMYY